MGERVGGWVGGVSEVQKWMQDKFGHACSCTHPRAGGGLKVDFRAAVFAPRSLRERQTASQAVTHPVLKQRVERLYRRFPGDNNNPAVVYEPWQF